LPAVTAVTTTQPTVTFQQLSQLTIAHTRNKAQSQTCSESSRYAITHRLEPLLSENCTINNIKMLDF